MTEGDRSILLKGILSLQRLMSLSLKLFPNEKLAPLQKGAYGGLVELNASKLYISEECVQKLMWMLCIHVILPITF